ncbi:MAG: nuclear transport factor 2 family protein [Desulfatiglans sp.]|nr:nuclear transport factor 2 family protein [Desulfatiglans sp.]
MEKFNKQEDKSSFFSTLSVVFAVMLLAVTLMAGCETKNAEYEKLLDRIQIEDMIVKYYVDMGEGKHHDLAMYYTEDAILDVNNQVSKGREEIEKLYAGVGGSGEAAFSGKMHMLLNNAIIEIDGDTAKAWFIWTGVMNEDIKAPPRFQEQGREYDELVKINGNWFITKRYITADSGLPEMWEKSYKPRSFR